MIAEIWAWARRYHILCSFLHSAIKRPGVGISNEKVDFRGEITVVTGSVTTPTKGKACRNPRDGSPEQKICKQLDTATAGVFVSYAYSIACDYLPDTNENIISDNHHNIKLHHSNSGAGTGLI